VVQASRLPALRETFACIERPGKFAGRSRYFLTFLAATQAI